MPIEFSTARSEEMLQQILTLQRKNLRTNLSEAKQDKEGFVYAEHSLSVLKTMAAYLPQVIALDQNRVVGYNLAMLSSMKNELPSLTPMFIEFEKSQYNGKKLADYSFMIGGQVCVDDEYRGQGLLKKLYHETKAHLKDRFQLCVTEISEKNTPSLIAHHKMGFKTIRKYTDGETNWHIVAWEF